MDDLVRDATLTGPQLVNAIRNRLGSSASIKEILDVTRDVNIRRYALELAARKFESVFEMFNLVHTWDLVREDIGRLFEMIATNNDGEFSGEIAKHAAVLLDSGMLHLVLKTTAKPVPLQEEPVRLTWVHRLCIPKCLRRPSPDTDK